MERFRHWNEGFQRAIADGQLPALTSIRLSNDQMQGVNAGKASPRSQAADNDWAIGSIVATVSKNPYWQDTAIFVIEDDAQNGPDHIDAHRSTALVISPYTRHEGGFIDHTLYDTASMLRTLELILGLPPMSQYDAAATPMADAFTNRADLRPYTAIPADPAILAERNPANAPAAAVSATLDFSVEDRAGPTTLNQLIWQSVKGNKKMPAPAHNKQRGTQTKDHDE